MKTAALALLVLAAPFARPQMDPQISADAVYSAGLGAVMYSTLESQKGGGAGKRVRATTPSAARAGTRFVPSAARRKAQAARFLAAARGMNAELGQALAPAFQNDPMRVAAPTLSRYGLRSNDVADLGAIYLASAWYGAHGKAGDPTRGEVQAVRDQLRRACAGSKIRRASNAAKQSVGEGFLFLAIVNSSFIATMRAHPEAKARLMAEIASGTQKTFGLNLRALRLSSAGFRKA